MRCLRLGGDADSSVFDESLFDESVFDGSVFDVSPTGGSDRGGAGGDTSCVFIWGRTIGGDGA